MHRTILLLIVILSMLSVIVPVSAECYNPWASDPNACKESTEQQTQPSISEPLLANSSQNDEQNTELWKEAETIGEALIQTLHEIGFADENLQNHTDLLSHAYHATEWNAAAYYAAQTARLTGQDATENKENLSEDEYAAAWNAPAYYTGWYTAYTLYDINQAIQSQDTKLLQTALESMSGHSFDQLEIPEYAEMSVALLDAHTKWSDISTQIEPETGIQEKNEDENDEQADTSATGSGSNDIESGNENNATTSDSVGNCYTDCYKNCSSIVAY